VSLRGRLTLVFALGTAALVVISGLLFLAVRDHGPGFPGEFLPHVFERFRRAGPARDRADGGTGLGLAIVASIARAHGGQAVAANHPDGGARVRIELPFIPD
jgi:two-component system, OmpR family, sensor kinase